MLNLRGQYFSGVKPAGVAWSVIVSLMLMLGAGCDMLESDVPPDKLPPVPEKCLSFSVAHKNALTAAYSQAEASQMQVARVANEFAQCMRDEGLSKGEAKGILKQNEAEAKQEAEKGGVQDIHIPQ